MHNIKGGRPPVPPNNGLYDLKGLHLQRHTQHLEPVDDSRLYGSSESDVVVLVNKPIPAANLPEVWASINRSSSPP